MVHQVVMFQIMFVVLLMILHNNQMVVGNLYWYLNFVLSPFYVLIYM